jgi:putative transposase
LGWLKEFSVNWQVDIHAWVLMINHVHLLCTPREAGCNPPINNRLFQ